MTVTLRLVFFTSLMLGITPTIAQEPLNGDIIFPRVLLLSNDPFSPFVRTSPILEAEKLVLELRNGFHQPVHVMDIFLENGDSVQFLLQEQKELVTAESLFIDVTQELGLLLAQTGQKETIVRISLSLEPTPDDQPEQSEYRVRFENGRFTEFRKIEVLP